MGSRYDEDDHDDFEDLRRSRRRSRSGYECPHCGCSAEPVSASQISTAGWVTFAILLAVCWPLFWIGLMMTETYQACGECGRKL